MGATHALTSSRCSMPSDIRAWNSRLTGCLQLSIDASVSVPFCKRVLSTHYAIDKSTEANRRRFRTLKRRRYRSLQKIRVRGGGYAPPPRLQGWRVHRRLLHGPSQALDQASV